MHSQSSVAVNNFTSDNYLNERHLVHTEMTLAQKLRVIKRCVEEKQLSNHYNNAHNFKNRLTKNTKSLKSTKVKKINLGISKIVNRISNVILDKQILELSPVELNSLINLVDKPTLIEKSTNAVQEPKLVGFLSLFTNNKISNSFFTIGYDRNEHHKRKTY